MRRGEDAKLVILVMVYETSPLFLVMVLCNLAKTRLALLQIPVLDPEKV